MIRLVAILTLYWAGCHLADASTSDDLAHRLGLETLETPGALQKGVGNSITQNAGIAIISEPLSAVTLVSSIIGQVETRPVKEGDHVKKGAVVLVLENKSEKLEAERRKLVWKDTTALKASSLREKMLKNLYDSSKLLYSKNGSVSLDELQKSELDYQLSMADRQHLELLEKQEKLDYQLAASILEKRYVKAPIDGTVTRFHLREGEGCEVNQPLVEIVDESRGLVVANLIEPIGRNLRKGQDLTIDLKSGQGTVTKEGRVIYLSPVVDPASGLMEVKVEFDNSDGTIRLGVAGVLNIN